MSLFGVTVGVKPMPTPGGAVFVPGLVAPGAPKAEGPGVFEQLASGFRSLATPETAQTGLDIYQQFRGGARYEPPSGPSWTSILMGAVAVYIGYRLFVRR